MTVQFELLGCVLYSLEPSSLDDQGRRFWRHNLVSDKKDATPAAIFVHGTKYHPLGESTTEHQEELQPASVARQGLP